MPPVDVSAEREVGKSRPETSGILKKEMACVGLVVQKYSIPTLSSILSQFQFQCLSPNHLLAIIPELSQTLFEVVLLQYSHASGSAPKYSLSSWELIEDDLVLYEAHGPGFDCSRVCGYVGSAAVDCFLQTGRETSMYVVFSFWASQLTYSY